MVKIRFRFTLEASLLGVLIFCVLVVRTMPAIEPSREAPFIPQITIEVMDIPQTRQELSVKGQPVKPVIPIASDRAEEILVDDKDVIFGTEDGLLEIPAPPAPPGGKGKDEYFPPKLMISKFPEYPEALRKQGISGVVVLQVKVDVNGNVVDHKVKSNTTGNSTLEKLAIETVYKCKYNPASDGKKKLEAWTDHKFEFSDKAK